VIEKVTGHSLAEELNARIFRPLRLEHTSFPASPNRLLPKQLVNEMKAPEGRAAGHPELLYGLGLYRQPLSCSLVWGHNGDTPGYDVNAFNSADGARQVVEMVNTDSDSFTPAQAKAINTLLDIAYCG
jgi:D-alanyl-D-alanine carboxypeptidase